MPTASATDIVYVWPPPPLYGALAAEYAFCIEMRDLVADAIRAALKSGVKEYHVGSRGLVRYDLKQLQDMLDYWINRAAIALNGGSSMSVKRAVPCDV